MPVSLLLAKWQVVTIFVSSRTTFELFRVFQFFTAMLYFVQCFIFLHHLGIRPFLPHLSVQDVVKNFLVWVLFITYAILIYLWTMMIDSQNITYYYQLWTSPSCKSYNLSTYLKIKLKLEYFIRTLKSFYFDCTLLTCYRIYWPNSNSISLFSSYHLIRNSSFIHFMKP